MAIVREKCPNCTVMVDRDTLKELLLDPNRDTVKHKYALHICAGSVETMRSKAQKAAPKSTKQAAMVLSACIKGLQELGRAARVPTQTDLIAVLAADMARKSGGDPASYMGAAEGQILGNNTTALTTSDDMYTGVEGGVKFDELHELVHICSGVGGESPLHKFKLQINEGCINYFSELACPEAGVTVVDRYVTETGAIRLLLDLFGDKRDVGVGKLYDMTFKGEIDPFFAAVGQAYNSLEKTPSGNAKGWSEKNKNDSEIATLFKNKLKNWDMKWLNDRLVAA